MANFPTSVSSNSNLYIAVNGLQTTLALSILSTDTTIQLTSTTNFPSTGYVTIDNSEVVLYSGISGPNLTGCTRGADGTTAAAHSLGVTVGLTIVAAHHNLLKDEVIAIETALGAGFAKGNITAGSSKISVTGGTGAIIGSGVTVDIGTFNLANLSDASISSLTSGQLVEWNGTHWVNYTPIWVPLAGGTMTGTLIMSNQNGIQFNDTEGTPKSVTIEAPTTVVASYTVKLPTAQGGANTFLQNDGSGNTSWVAGGSGTISNGTTGRLAQYTGTTTIGDSSNGNASMDSFQINDLANGTSGTDASTVAQAGLYALLG